MTLIEALKILDIEDYKDRIFNSNSRGELFHLSQYAVIADVISKDPDNGKWFRPWFEDVVRQAESKWDRPESVFQHIGNILMNQMKQSRESTKNH